jgi:hypothetical protein
MKKETLLLVLIVCTLQALSQNEGTLTFMNSLPQVVNNNPAFVPRYKVAVGLPISSIMGFYSNNGFSYNDMIKRENDSLKFDLVKLYSAASPKNYITQAMQVDLLRVGVKIGNRFYFSLVSTAKIYNRLQVPKDLLGILTNGNEPFIGKTATLSPQGESISFLETSLGGAYRLNDKLAIGTRLKLLKGITNITTQSASANLSMDNATYAITGNASMDVRTSGIYNFSQAGFNLGDHLKDYMNNTGVGLDVGATYQLQDRLTLGASIIDWGVINWSNNTYGYSLDPTTANYTFQGIDLNKVLNGDESYTKSIGDTLQTKFKVKENATGSYHTFIPTKLYLNGMYQLKENLTVGAVFFAEKFRDRLATGLTLGLNKHFGKVLSASGSYTVTSNSFNNVGAGLSLNLSPIQIYVVGDNLLRIPFAGKEVNTFVNNTQFFNVRFGINFVFGLDERKKEKTSSASKKNPDLENSLDNTTKVKKRKVYKNYIPDKKKED